ncbi:MAG: hypothetical protein ACRDTF_20640 [Pseudonocardiaceae bacterium]
MGPGARFDNIGLGDTGDYPALGFDPAPGAPSSVVALAQSFDQVATRLDAAHGALTGIGRSGGIWQGEAAEGFRGTVGELPGYLDKARTSLGGASALARAKEHAPEEPGLFDRIGDLLSSIGKAVEDLAADVWQWVKDHAETIKKIGDILSAIGTVLSIAAVALAPVPVVGQVVLAAAIGVNGAALAAHGLAKAAGADVSWSTLAFDGLGMIPGGGVAKGTLGAVKAAPTVGRAVAQGVRGAADVGEAISRGGKAAAEALEGLSKSQFAKWVDTYNSVATRVGAEAVQAGSTAAHVAGAAVGTVEKVSIAAGRWVVDPYLDRATDVGKDYYDALSNGARPPSAAETFNRVVHGRAAE